MRLIYICIVFIFILVANERCAAQNIYKQLQAEKCDSLIEANTSNPNFVILDVRTESQWISEHLEGSICRSLYDSDFVQQLNSLTKHKIYLLHCYSGGRSAKAFKNMQELGFNEVYEMIGGIAQWKNKKLPTTQKVEPKLMLVSHQEIDGYSTDTVKITITNRANDQLKFTSISIDDDHAIIHSFDNEILINGAEDYTFSIYHSPDYNDEDSTRISIESNGGQLELNVNVEQTLATNIYSYVKNTVSIFPNPAKERIFIKGISTDVNTSVVIYTIAGQMVLEKHNYSNGSQLAVSNLSEGIHIVKIKSGDNYYSKKLFVKH